MNKKAFDLIITVVNKGFSDYVIDTAKKGRRGGATIIHGRGTGIHEQDSFFGISIPARKRIGF